MGLEKRVSRIENRYGGSVPPDGPTEIEVIGVDGNHQVVDGFTIYPVTKTNEKRRKNYE